MIKNNDILVKKQKIFLTICFSFNFLIFLLNLITFFIIHSFSLLTDSIDSLFDTVTYIIAFFAIFKMLNDKKKMTYIIVSLQLLSSLVLLEETLRNYFSSKDNEINWKLFIPFSMIGLVCNLTCTILMYKLNKLKEPQISASFLFSAIDVYMSLAIVIASIICWRFSTNIPDVVVATTFCSVVLITCILQYIKLSKKI